MTWRDGFRGICSLVFFLCVVVGAAGTGSAGGSYRHTLKKWTRHATDYGVENLEMRLKWHATYRSPEFLEAERAKLSQKEGWTEKERERRLRDDEKALRLYDEFFMSVYSGSSAWPDVGKETGRWRFALRVGETLVEPVSLERVEVTESERELYPYLDHWSKAYRLRFPKTIPDGESFVLQMRGIPVKSELVWGVKSSRQTSSSGRRQTAR